MKLLDNKFIKYAFMAIVLCLIVYDFYYLPNALRREEESGIKYLQCPLAGNFESFWDAWSYDYSLKYPLMDAEGQMNDWNTLMKKNGCMEEWQNPFGIPLKE